MKEVKLIDASFLWTEPHSKRLKVKLQVRTEYSSKALESIIHNNSLENIQVQAEVVGGAILQQVMMMMIKMMMKMIMMVICRHLWSSLWWLIRCAQTVTGPRPRIIGTVLSRQVLKSLSPIK